MPSTRAAFVLAFVAIISASIFAPVSVAASFRFPDVVDPLAAARDGAPMALTASDGTGLVLVEMHAKAVISGPLALTELHLVFQNPQSRVLEGRFQITLPARASVSRFAMKTAKRWQEGEVIERERARRVYEDFLHRRQDPALLEQGEANEFGARVFPIPAKGRKELILSYAQPLTDASTPYVLPLQGLPRIGALSVDVSGGAAPFSLRKRDYVPTNDVSVNQAAGAPQGLRHNELVAVRVRPVASAPEASVSSLLFLVDTSASRALAMERQVRLVDALTKALVAGGHPTAPIAIVAFDQESKLIFSGPANKLDRRALQALRRRRALGASDLGQALDFAASIKGRFQRALLISDGVATAGIKDAALLDKKIGALARIGVQRLDAAMLGGLRDEARLTALTTGALKNNGVVVDADRGVREVARKMARATRSKVSLQIEGAEWTWPTSVSGIQPGDDVLVFARLEKGVKDVRVRVDNKRAGAVAVVTVKRPLIERAVAEADIARLTSARALLQGPEVASERKRLKDAIVSMSTKNRVLSRFTSLLVLETAEDYARYGIAETAMSDILVVKDGKIAVADRRVLPPAKPIPKKPKPKVRPRKDARKMKKRSRASSRNGDVVMDGKVAREKSEEDFDDDSSGEESDEFERNAPMFNESGAIDGAPPMESVASVNEEAPTQAFGRGGATPNDAPAAPQRLRAETAPSPASVSRAEPVSARTRERTRIRPQGRVAPRPATKLPATDAWTGQFADVMKNIQGKKANKALTLARSWREEEPGNVLALVALGRAHAAKGQKREAARAYGSIIDLHPARADLRRFAGNLLESLDDKRALVLAAESYGEATVQRRDHPAGWRLLAFALARLNRFEEAVVALETSINVNLPGGRFANVKQILREDLGLIVSMRIKHEGKKSRKKHLARLKKAGGLIEDKPSVRFVLSWETDANDVDFHIYDAKGGHAFYGSRALPSGGTLYADVTTGYGPECFTVRNSKRKRAGPYRLRAHYYSRGPMGYGMGALQVIDHVNGKITVRTAPFVVMKDSAYVDLGTTR